MTVINSKAKLVEGSQIVVDNGRTHSVCLDLPPDQGTDRGPTALELAVIAFAGCVVTTFVLMTKKLRLQISGLEVAMRAEKPEGNSTVTNADYTIIVKSGEGEANLEKAFELTRASCPVGLLFEKAGVQVSFELKIVKE